MKFRNGTRLTKAQTLSFLSEKQIGDENEVTHKP